MQYKMMALNATSLIIDKYELDRFSDMKDIVTKYLTVNKFQ